MTDEGTYFFVVKWQEKTGREQFGEPQKTTVKMYSPDPDLEDLRHQVSIERPEIRPEDIWIRDHERAELGVE